MTPLRLFSLCRPVGLAGLVMGYPVAGWSQQLVAPPAGIFREGVYTAPAVTAPSAGRVDNRVDAAVSGSGQRSDAGIPPVRTQAVEVGVSASVEYNDNIFLSADAPESDLVSKLAVPLAYRRGDEQAAEGAFVRAAYTPTGVFYAGNGDENRVDHAGSLQAGWEGEQAGVSYKGEVRRLGEASADVGGQYDRTELVQVLRVAWKPREKVRLEAAAGHEAYRYDDAALADSDTLFAEAAVRYAWTPKTEFRAAYRGGSVSVDGSGDQVAHQLTAGMNWKPREKVRLDFMAGVDHRTFDAGQSTTPILAASATWLPREGTELSVNAYRRVEASAFLPGENYTLTGFSAALSQRLGRRWTATLKGGVESSDYLLASGNQASGREDLITFIRPGLAYRFNDDLSLQFYLSSSRNDSNTDGFGYDNLLGGVRLDYAF